MSKRLQVLLPPKEYQSFRQIAREAGLSLGEWVRQALREIAGRSSRRSPQAKLKSIRHSSKFSGPTADIDQMLSEIEQGYSIT